MKIKLYISIFYSVVLLSGAVSCERSFLYPWPPDGARTPEDVWNYYDYTKGFLDAVSADNLTVALYSEVGGYGSFASASDEAEHSDPAGVVQYFTNGVWNPTNVPNALYGGPWATSTERMPWANAYQAIRRVNIFLANVDNSPLIDDPTNPARRFERTQEKGYAYFLRAWFQFDLFRKYGPFPIVKKALSTEDNLFFPRNTMEECYQAIVEDLDMAINMLPVIWNDNNWGKASRGAAYALKSRLMLYYASPLYQGKFEEFGISANTVGDVERWKNAVKAAREMINLNDFYSLQPVSVFVAPYTQSNTYTSQVGLMTNMSQREFIWASPASSNKAYNDERYNLPTGQEGFYGYVNPTQEMVDAFEVVINHNKANAKAVPFDWNNPVHAKNPYGDRDPRFYASILYNGRVWGNSTSKAFPVDTYNGGKHRQLNNPNSTKTGYYYSKFLTGNYYSRQTGDYTNPSRHKCEIRLAEIILNYAEAMNEVYGATGVDPEGGIRLGAINALQAVNLIRERVKMPLLTGTFSKDEMREKIKHERRIELCFEGHRMYDLRRWKEGDKLGGAIHGVKAEVTGFDTKGRPTGFTYTVEKVEDRVWRDCMYWWPVPYSEVVKYAGVLTQNPGWEKK